MDGLKKLILICGDEDYLKQEKKKELFQQLHCEGGPDFHTFSGRETDFGEVLDLAETLPMFSGKRVLLLDDTGLFKQTPEKHFPERLKNLPDSTVVIFLENEIDERNVLSKLLKAEGSVFRFQQVVGLRDWKAANAGKFEIRSWIRDYMKTAGKKIDSRAVEALTELSGYNMMNLQTELEKLISCPADPITENTIRDICSKTITDRVFDMMDQKLSGNTADALLLLEDMLSIRVEPMKILYLLGKQFRQVYVLKELESRHLNDAEILAEMGIRDWQLRKLRDKSRGRSVSDMLYLTNLCLETETAVKNGDLPERLAVEIILCS